MTETNRHVINAVATTLWLPGIIFLPRNRHDTSGCGVAMATHWSKLVPVILWSTAVGVSANRMSSDVHSTYTTALDCGTLEIGYSIQAGSDVRHLRWGVDCVARCSRHHNELELVVLHLATTPQVLKCLRVYYSFILLLFL